MHTGQHNSLMKKKIQIIFHFLNVSLRRQKDRNLSLSVYRKASWNREYVNISSFVPMVQKRNFFKDLGLRLVYLNLPFRDDVSHDIVLRQLDR